MFINRRTIAERRADLDRCKNMSLDLYHRKRRKTSERRATNRSLSQDYYSYTKQQSLSGSQSTLEDFCSTRLDH